MGICSTDYYLLRVSQDEEVTLDLTAPKGTITFILIEEYIMDNYPIPSEGIRVEVGTGEDENKLIVTAKPELMVKWLEFMGRNYKFSPWHVKMLSMLAKEDRRRKIVLKEQSASVSGKYVVGGEQLVPWFESPWEATQFIFKGYRKEE